MTTPVAIFAVGNASRGDDAVGPLLLARLRDWLEAQGIADGFELFEEYQLQVENALDLEDRRLALFIDACGDGDGPVTFGPVGAAGALLGHSSHALSPGAVLGVYRRVTGEAAPPAFQLGVRGCGFELGAPPSVEAREAMEVAWTLLRALCGRPGHAEWLGMALPGSVLTIAGNRSNR